MRAGHPRPHHQLPKPTSADGVPETVSLLVSKASTNSYVPIADMSPPKSVPSEYGYHDEDSYEHDDGETSNVESEHTVNAGEAAATELSRLQSQHNDVLQEWNRSIDSAINTASTAGSGIHPSQLESKPHYEFRRLKVEPDHWWLVNMTSHEKIVEVSQLARK